MIDLNPTVLLDAESDFVDGPGDALAVRRQQIITDSFLNYTHEARLDQVARSNNFHQVAAVPTLLVEVWKRQGFDINDRNIKARDIVKRLKAEGLDQFVTTPKRV